MAAGAAAADGQAARGSSTTLEAALDRRFQGISNTMESIQALSTWCIENKKNHGQIVRSWMKWLKKSDNNHRLNLFYVANDVIQNCKRKNAIVFRPSFAEVLPNATQLIRDPKVRKSIDRIFTIWEERSVYPAETIAQFKVGLNKKEEREKQREKEKKKEKEREKQMEKEKEKEKPPPASSAPSTTKAALKSKILAEFAPQTLIEDLSQYKQVVAEEEFREKQLTALRVDVCSTEALKRLKDKAGGNKFAKDFEEGSLKLQEFVSFLETEMKRGSPLLESLGNADIFYEMQYKEVKIVANAYSAFANRVASLKRKLDSLKATLPGAEDSPIPSPSEDAPSPTGSDSPFLPLGVNRAQVDPELDGKAMDESHDNQEDDMDVSDEEAEALAAGENKKDEMSPAVDAAKVPTTPTKASKSNTPSAATAATSSASSGVSPANPLGVNLAKVDLGKISSILNSLTSAMKNTSSPALKSTPGTPSTPSGQSSSTKTSSPSPALASILSRVDITPEGILNALSKTNSSGLSSLLSSVTNSSASASLTSPPAKAAVKTPVTPTPPKPKLSLSSIMKRETPGRNKDRDRDRQMSPPPPSRSKAPSMSTPSLESKINSFLQGNPGFSLALGDLSPDGVDGTPVRDEAGGTPTQDEMMDTPGSVPESLGSSGSHPLSPTAYRSEPWDAVITPSGSSSEGDLLASSRFGAVKKSHTKLKEEDVRTHSSSHSSKEGLKGKSDGHPGYYKNKAVSERRVSACSRKMSSGSEDGGFSGKREGKARGGSPGADGKEGQYHRIETLVSPCTEGVPIETLSYSNRQLTGEPIRTVESIRVIGRSPWQGGGGGMWYEEEEYMEAQSPSPIAMAPPLNMNRRNSEEMPPSLQLPLPLPMPLPPPPPPPHPFLHLHPPPPHPLPPHPPPLHPLPPHHHSLPPLPMPPHFSLPYPPEAPPGHHHQHPPPSSPFFNAPMSHQRHPPPLPQRPPTPPHRSSVPTAVMVGGMLIPVERPLPMSHPVRSEGPERGSPRASKGPRFMCDPPRQHRTGTVKEPFGLRMAPPLHRPGTPGVPPPLLGRVKEPPNLPPPRSSRPPTSTSPSPANSPDVATAPPVPPSTTPSSEASEQKAPELKVPEQKDSEQKDIKQKDTEQKVSEQKVPEQKVPEQKAPVSTPAPPRPKTPVSFLNMTRPLIMTEPIPQRPLVRGRLPPPSYRGFRGKRHGPPFGGPFYPPKRPFLPPRY